LAVGLAAGALVAAIACIPLRWLTDALRWAPVIAALALRSEGLAGDRVVVGIAVAAAASLVPTWPLRAAGALAGAGLALDAVPFVLSSRWTAAVIGCTVAALVLVTRAERDTDRSFTSVCLVVTLAGVYAGPPDTEVTTVVGAVAGIAALAVLVLPWQRRRSVPDASAALVVLTCWTAIVESQGRLAAFPAAIACFGVLLVEPLVRLVTTTRSPLPTMARWQLLAIHVAAVGVASRVAAPQTSVTASVAISGVALVFAAALTFARLAIADRAPHRATAHVGSARIGVARGSHR
jgi:hypothetical protein